MRVRSSIKSEGFYTHISEQNSNILLLSFPAANADEKEKEKQADNEQKSFSDFLNNLKLHPKAFVN
jgi:hypothetical protein